MMNNVNSGEIAVFAMGCFWGPDDYFSKLAGVISTRVGYAAGTKENPTYEDLGVQIIKTGAGKRVDLIKLLPILKTFGINTILLEGGGTLNWSFIQNNFIDEIRLTIAPWIVGGKEAISLVEGIGFEEVKNSPRFDLFDVKIRTYYITLSYLKRN